METVRSRTGAPLADRPPLPGQNTNSTRQGLAQATDPVIHLIGYVPGLLIETTNIPGSTLFVSRFAAPHPVQFLVRNGDRRWRRHRCSGHCAGQSPRSLDKDQNNLLDDARIDMAQIRERARFVAVAAYRT